MKHSLLVVIMMLSYTLLFSQQDAWVYLVDKENVSASISNPISILTAQAINRKNAKGIAIDVRDVPVNEAYISQLKLQSGITVMAKSKWFNAVHVRGSEIDINNLSNLAFVESVDFADKNLNPEGRQTTQQSKQQQEASLINFSYGSTQNQVEMINIDGLHQLNFTGDGMIVAVLDSGFPNVNTMSAFQRLRTNGDLLDGYDFVSRSSDVYQFTGSDHGTKTLSTMAGFVQDQYVGTAPDASYYVFRTEDVDSENPVEESYWVEAAERADSLGVHIINSSLGYTVYDNPNYSYTPDQMDGQTAFISRGANMAAEKGILVVNSAGNSGNSSWQIVGAPADAADVFTIGGVDSQGNYSSFSSRGSAIQPTLKPDVVAKASSTSVISQSGSIVNNSGTSFSSPIMAGAIACLMQALPELPNEDLKQVIRMSASQYDSPDYFLGFGIPNMQQALDIALSQNDVALETFKIFPNPVKEILNIKSSSILSSELKIFDVMGKEMLHQKLNTPNNRIDVSGLSSGVYILHVISSVNSITHKFIKS